MISREEATLLIYEHLDKEKIKHSILVSRIMKSLAKNFCKDQNKWELVGLLHDLDYEITRTDRKQHGIVAAKMLEGKLPEECLHAIKAHDHRTGVKPTSLIDMALIVSDIIAVLVSGIASKASYGKIGQMKIDEIRRELEKESLFKEKLGARLRDLCSEIDLTIEDLIGIAIDSIIEDRR